MRTRSLYLALLALAACNPDLKAEKKAWERHREYLSVWNAEYRKCRAQSHHDELLDASLNAGKACTPFEDALSRAMGGGDQEWLDAYSDMKNAPACQEAKRKQEAYSAALDKTQACLKPATAESDLRKAEYVAACQKCGLKERCEKNLEENDEVADALLTLSGERKWNKPPPPEKLAEMMAEAKLKAKKGLVFACDK